MSKKSVGLIGIVVAIAMFCSAFFSGCGLSGNNNNHDDNTPVVPSEYVIQYTDDTGSHTLTVKDGVPYSLEQVPERLGYDFLGLFDAKVGGTQYVDETGQSLAPFTDKKNLVLFPQFAAKEYTVVLDYQGATVTGQRSLTVKYNEKLPELPKNLSKEHSVFEGWYTEENCGGTQVADAYGLIPGKSTLNESLFDIDGTDEYLYLYAGFDVETFNVTFNFGSGIPSEEVKVEWNTPISEVVPETRNSEGQAVLSWSKTQSGSQIFTGNVTDDIVLYAVEWAPVIEFDSNGGNDVVPLVARAGAPISLPQCAREDYTFRGWFTEDGILFEESAMPQESLRLCAVWWAQIIFDSRGGEEVATISQESGTQLQLPETNKEGFIFAGWYRGDEKAEFTTMPSESVRLQAMYYRVNTETLVIIQEDSILEVREHYNFTTTFVVKADTKKLDFTQFDVYDWQGAKQIRLNFHVKIRDAIRGGFYNGTFLEAYFKFFSINNTSSANLVADYTFKNQESELKEWKQLEFALDMPVIDGAVYFEFSAKCKSTNGAWGGDYGARIGDMWAEMQIPDTSNLV